MAGKFKLSAAILCDDVRREDNGKYMLIGVYTGGMTFSSPMPVRKRGLFVFSLGNISGTEIEISYRLKHESSSEVVMEGKANLELIQKSEDIESEFSPIEIPFPFGPLEFKKTGGYIAQFKDVSGRWKQLLSFKVTAKE